jgi:oligopeptide transport system ATP-binding protein
MTATLEVNGLKRHFELSDGRTLHAVDGVSFQLQQNEVLGLVGESGCGKSTLGRTIVGLYDKTDGSVSVDGERTPTAYTPKDFQKFSRKVQMIFQDPYSALNPRMTVRDIVAEGPRLLGLWKDQDIDQKVALWLSRVGLSAEQMSRYPHEFSGGQRQRIGIARALALEPKILICDEPISALDVSIQAQVINLLAELKRSLGLTILFIAHDLSMVRYISDRMAVMYLGSIVEIGPSDEVFFEPLHPYSQLLVSSNPEPDPDHRSELLTTPNGEVPTPIDLKSGCRFAKRCPLAEAKCHSVTPNLEASAPGHFVACHVVNKNFAASSSDEATLMRQQLTARIGNA